MRSVEAETIYISYQLDWGICLMFIIMLTKWQPMFHKESENIISMV